MDWFQKKAMDYLRGELSEEETKVFEETLANSAPLRAEIEQSRELLELLSAARDEQVIKVVHGSLQKAIKQRASDIHVVPWPDATIILFRIDGRLQEAERISGEVRRSLVLHWKLMSDCNLTERTLPQHGRIGITHQGTDYDVHVTCMPTRWGEHVTARIVLKPSTLTTLEEVGFAGDQVGAVRKLLRQPAGLTLMVNPLGSSWPLFYALLGELIASGNDPCRIVTIEDPIERMVWPPPEEGLREVCQVAVNRHTGLTFAAGLRAALRSDPDRILVGGLPDRETVELALRGATDYPVVAVLAARNALDAVTRLRAMGADSFLLAQTLTGVIGQRRVRRSCPNCVTEYEPADAALAEAGLSWAEDRPFRRGAGCEVCRQTGYRLGHGNLFEILEIDDRLRRLIANDASEESLWRETFGRRGGSLWDDAREKVRQGITTVEEVARALFDCPAPGLVRGNGMNDSPPLAPRAPGLPEAERR